MEAVITFGEDHPEFLEVAPPSPNQSCHTPAEQQAILQAHRAFQQADLVQPGPPVAVPTVPASPATLDVIEPVAPAQVESASVNQSVASGVPAVLNQPGSVLAAGNSIYPVDNPGPASILGGFTAFESFIEMGDVQFDNSVLDWFKLSSAPSQFQLVNGPRGPEFRFCVPAGGNVEVDEVARVGHREVGIHVRPESQGAGLQCALPINPNVPLRTHNSPVDAPPPDDPPVDPVGGESGASDTSSATVSTAAAVEERLEFIAAFELTK